MKYFKKCEEFYICGSKNKKKEIFAESGDKSLTLFQIIVKGRGKLITTSDSMSIVGMAGEVVDCRSFMGKDRILLSDKDSEDYYEVYGFNTLVSSHNWSATKLISSFTGNDKSWIICFDGTANINGNLVEKFDYAKLENKDYKLEINDALLVMFTRL